MNTIIHCDNVKLQFGQQILFENLSLQVKAQEKLILSTPSGSGKSSLLKALAGMLPTSTGNISVFGQKLQAKDIEQIREKISYIEQDCPLPNMPLCDLLQEIGSYNKQQALNAQTIRPHFEYFGLNKETTEKNTGQLSGGERARVALSIVRWQNKPLVLLDEPTAALDQKLAQLVVGWVRQSEQTFIIVSHDSIWKDNNFTTLKSWDNASNRY